MTHASLITCPHCGAAKLEQMPTDACVYFYYVHVDVATLLRPKPGDCCVFCSYGSVPCPPIQREPRDRALRTPSAAAEGRGRTWAWRSLDALDWAKAVAVGIGVSILTALFMLAGLKSGISPLPKPLGLAFAETVLKIHRSRFRWAFFSTRSG